MTYTLTGALEKKSVTWVGAQVKKENAPGKSYKCYPFGLQTANSWTRENSTANQFLFNGGTELNSTTSIYDLHYRGYDPQLGRMNQVDPVAGKYASQTPYNYAFNSPTNLNDPLGDESIFNRDAWRGNTGRATYYGTGMVKDAGSSGGVGGGSLSFAGWGAQYNSVANNLGLMSSRQFESFYGVDLNSGAGRDWLQSNTAQQVYQSAPGSGGGGGGFGNTLPVTLGSTPTVYSAWAGTDVPASEILSYSGDISNQRASLRMAALMAMAMSSLSQPLNSAGGYQEGLKILSAQLWTADAGFFTMDAYAEYRLATNNAIRTNFTRATGYYWNPGALKNSDKFFKALKIGASALGKVTFGLGVAASLYSVYQKPTVENAAWAAADITVGAIGLGSGAIATWAGTVGLAIPGLNVIIAGGALAYAGYRLYQAYKDDN